MGMIAPESAGAVGPLSQYSPLLGSRGLGRVRFQVCGVDRTASQINMDVF